MLMRTRTLLAAFLFLLAISISSALAQTPEWIRAQRIGGTGEDHANGVVTDGSGNVYVTGAFIGSMTLGSTTVAATGGADFYLAKFNRSGALQWVRTAGG